VSVARPNRNPPRFVRTSALNHDQLANAGRFRKRTKAAKNCFSTSDPVALRYITLAVGKFARVQSAQIGKTVLVFPREVGGRDRSRVARLVIQKNPALPIVGLDPEHLVGKEQNRDAGLGHGEKDYSPFERQKRIILALGKGLAPFWPRFGERR
jgi:hypothetical protein